MVLTCDAPRKKYPSTPCDRFVGVVPDSAVVVGRLEHSSERRYVHTFVMLCGCGALYEVAPEPIQTAA